VRSFKQELVALFSVEYWTGSAPNPEVMRAALAEAFAPP
jgi:hypothetical protein